MWVYARLEQVRSNRWVKRAEREKGSELLGLENVLQF